MEVQREDREDSRVLFSEARRATYLAAVSCTSVNRNPVGCDSRHFLWHNCETEHVCHHISRS